ncbi:hypothetical protein [Actinomadura livida]|uniref:Transcriptional regulator n=1 Tax=Actinomadura livida TaxID=79909 RepID=A0A7W7MV44_9ACTN|nr:hypothetical protein [Actinomadura catellatispora]GGU27844.1 hypothetical protein GCM10010208_60910 [Actinomadura livida]
MSNQAAGCCSPLAAEPLAEAEAVELARVFKALSDPVRLRLLTLIGAHAGGRQAGVGVRRSCRPAGRAPRRSGRLRPARPQ